MVHDEMLRALIELAQKNGWEDGGLIWENDRELQHNEFLIIFDHEFVKAIYGENEHDEDFDRVDGHRNCHACGHGDWLCPDYCWQFLLEKQAVSDDPLKFMYENRRKD